MKYTTFCRDSEDLYSTTHITSVVAENIEDAMRLGRIKCMHDWFGLDDDLTDDQRPELEQIMCMGVAEGNVTILYWKDLSE